MKLFPRDRVIFAFSQDNASIYEVMPDEIFWVDTDDCYSGQISDESIKRPDIDISIMDCAVGPIAIQGAKKGDTLCVEVLAIDLADHGVMVTSCGLGVLGSRITEPNTKIIPIHDGFAHFSDEIKLPLTPMVGVCGVAPKAGESIHCAVPGRHGSNMDTKMLKVGSRLYLPVEQDGAGLAVGDIHSCMGDGELSGTGIETAGRICLRCHIYTDRPVDGPVIETDDSIYFLQSATDFNSGIEAVVAKTVAFLEKEKGLSFPDAYRLVSATCDIQISQVVNDLVTLRCRVPKLDLAIQTYT